MTHINIASLEVGQEIGSEVFTFTRDSLVKYAGASGDFNPIHYRDDFAKSVGLDGVLAHGMLTMGAAVQVAVNWVGDAGKVIDYGVRFTKPVFVDANEGALLTVVGKVGAIDLETKTVRIDLTAVSNELAVLGKAQAVVKL
ncbi:MAG: MaoC family dehydratase [Actinomycetes bacterium]